MLALGTRFGETDWWGKPPYWGTPEEQRLIQVDIDEEILGLNKPGGPGRACPTPGPSSKRCSPSSSSASLLRTSRPARRGIDVLGHPEGTLRDFLRRATADEDAGADALGLRPPDLSRGLRRRRRARDRRRQHRGLDEPLPRESRARLPPEHLQVRDAGRGRRPGARCEGRVCPSVRSTASSATVRWGFIPRRSRPPSATTCP